MLLQMLLENITAAPSAPLEDLVIMDGQEQQLVLHTFNKTELGIVSGGAFDSATINGMLQYWAGATPNAPSVVYEVSLFFLLPEH